MRSPLLFAFSVLLLGNCQARLLLIQNETLYSGDMVDLPQEEPNKIDPLLHSENETTWLENNIDLPLEAIGVELSERAAGCSITIRSKEMKDPQPLLIVPGTSKFFPFSASGKVDVAYDNSIEFACTSSLASPLSGKSVTAKCAGGQNFKIGNQMHPISAIKCSSWPSFMGKKSGSKCNGGTTLINVGFELSNSRFAKEYEVCFDEVNEVTRYVYHTLDAGSNNFAQGVDRINFATGGYFAGKDVDRLYTQVTQKQTIDKTLGMDSSRYFDSQRNIFLARGHLAAKADFVYSPEQRATFLFINVAPQWQTFNAGNWARVEDGVRAWVSKNKKHVECYTGVWGVTTLPNNKGVETPLYLAYDRNNNGLIPVPKIYFRVVIEPSTRKGIVLVGVNNPHLSLNDIKRDYILCKDVADKINWISWKRSDRTAGYSYACEVPEFRKRVTSLPDFNVSGLLI